MSSRENTDRNMDPSTASGIGSTERALRVQVDEREVLCPPGTTWLEAASRVGIEIPTLCHDPRVTPEASCTVCLVEVRQGDAWVMHPACSTRARDGASMRTHSPEILRARRWALELLLSDHYADCVAPCVLSCPAQVDVPGYIRAVREGDHANAVEIVRRTNPLPGVCGRVCFHRCESVCRRREVDEPVAINHLKRAATDACLGKRAGLGAPAANPAAALDTRAAARRTAPTGKRVAVIGAGPAGLSAAYYLRLAGHGVTVLDAEKEPGGMLRYGIPAYRLPRDVLDADIAAIREIGVELKLASRLGRDYAVEDLLRDGHDAVFVAIGAWKERPLSLPGAQGENVLCGVEFLKRVNEGTWTRCAGAVGVVGGGNTAIDAARAAVRLGANRVTVLYRRSRTEMPAFEREIDAALAEGVILQCLVSPACVEREGSRLVGVQLQRMALGEPDESGRARSVPVPGELLPFALDLLIAAVGETPDLTAFESAPIGTARANVVDAATLQSSEPRVFAGGDFVTGPSSAIEAIAGGRRAAISIDAFLRTGHAEHPAPLVFSRRASVASATSESCQHIPRSARHRWTERSVHERIKGFAEVDFGYSAERAREEAERCLSCSCEGYDHCELRKHMQTLGVELSRVRGEAHQTPPAVFRPGIELDMNKCVRCTRCIRICREVAHVDAIDVVFRGFGARIFCAPVPTEDALRRCDTCLREGALCVDTCPTGALRVVDRTATLIRGLRADAGAEAGPEP